MYSYQSALFDDTLMPKAPQKAVLANAIWTRFPPDIVGPTGEVQHVLDGGVLLHLITWAHEFPTYQEICALYCHYVPRWLPHSIHQVHNQWRIVGSRGPGARNSVGPSAMVRPNVCQLEALEAPRWGSRQSPGGKHILATI